MRDLVADKSTFLALWGLPLAVIIATAITPTDAGLRTMAWTASFTVAGVGCLVNARRSRRVHCFLTGPYFLGLGAATVTHLYAGLPLGATGWWLIAAALAIGTPLLWLIPEGRRGRYAEGVDGCAMCSPSRKA
jgi:hypothetical protein